MAYLVTVLPREERPRTARVEKSTSKRSFLRAAMGLRCTVTTSASPLGFALRYSTSDPLVPWVMGYSRSRVIPVTVKRFMKLAPLVPSR